MFCETCKHWKATYAPYVKHGIPLIMTCELDETVDREWGKCKYWEKVENGPVEDVR